MVFVINSFFMDGENWRSSEVPALGKWFSKANRSTNGWKDLSLACLLLLFLGVGRC